MSHIVPLDHLRAGESGLVIDLEGDCSWGSRLQEMGIHRGSVVRMIRTGSPCILAVNEQRLSLRLCPEVTILVEVIETGSLVPSSQNPVGPR